MTTITYVLPVHNDEPAIAGVVGRLVDRLTAWPGSEVILVENGSADGSAEECRRLASAAGTDAVRVLVAQTPKGMGNADREGIRLSRGDLVVLTGSDLPFAFTDLDAFLALEPRPRLALGSKAHPASVVETSLLRTVMSAGFRLFRRLVLGIRAGDTQGTVIIEGTLARELLPRLECEDYLLTTEVVAWAARAGVEPVEVPVVYRRATSSTISPVRDASRMAIGLLRLRRRIRRGPAPGVRRPVGRS